MYIYLQLNAFAMKKFLIYIERTSKNKKIIG